MSCVGRIVSVVFLGLVLGVEFPGIAANIPNEGKRQTAVVPTTIQPLKLSGSTALTRVAGVERLIVIAKAPEDTLPTLMALPVDQRIWTVVKVGGKAVRLKGRIEEIGWLIDANQHTAIIKGTIDNPPKDLIGAGQFVTCTIQLPAKDGKAR